MLEALTRFRLGNAIKKAQAARIPLVSKKDLYGKSIYELGVLPTKAEIELERPKDQDTMRFEAMSDCGSWIDLCLGVKKGSTMESWITYCDEVIRTVKLLSTELKMFYLTEGRRLRPLGSPELKSGFI